ncbi:MAG: sulfatase [Phenylobacterium sp.]|uniref:sulfatase family protein n=1 Tax=Phenylobacterium sp. TaxID=1871053 RepID=UPI001A4CA79B|nr:sulfatase [Phenylobacterium sp.]MBL8772420.1 sulfatase [Phenylobacterium sp.]
MKPIDRRSAARSLLAGGLAAVLGGGGPALAGGRSRETGPPRPNFVVILTDDQGYADVGAYGAKRFRTPNIDRMAREGVRFTSFYAQPVCGPSRAALLTGSYPIKVAEPGNEKHPNTILHAREVTLAEVLKTAGYRTAAFGKWHMAGDGDAPWDFAPPPAPAGVPGGKGPFKPELMPNSQGFDHFFGLPMYHGYTLDPDNTRFIPELMRNREVVESPAEVATMTRRFTEEALRFIRDNRSQPFFVYLAQPMPHVPLDASPAFKGRSGAGPYGDAVEELDSNVGKLLDELRDLGLDRNTVVVFLSDNGPELKYDPAYRGEAQPLRGGKYSTWEGGLRVPAIVRWPQGALQGEVVDAMATTMDLLPTFAALAGAKLPDGRVIDGKNLAETLRCGRAAPAARDYFFYYSLTQLEAVRDRRWKLVLPRKGPSPYISWLGNYVEAVDEVQLFDLLADPGETTNLAARHPQVVARLTRQIADARDRYGDVDRVGYEARFYDPGPRRPTTLFPQARPPAATQQGGR